VWRTDGDPAGVSPIELAKRFICALDLPLCGSARNTGPPDLKAPHTSLSTLHSVETLRIAQYQQGELVQRKRTERAFIPVHQLFQPPMPAADDGGGL
jgi:hypothetical protein